MSEITLFVTAGIFAWWLSIRPSNARKWSADQAVLPEPVINGSEVLVRNIRNFTYRTEEDYVPGYYDKTFDVTRLERVYFVFVPFKKSKHAAHGFFVFEFTGGETVAVSVEIRKKHTQKYSALKGLMKQYELMYVIADEADVVGLRREHRQDGMYRYPLKLTRKQARQLFFHMMRRARKLYDSPEFYNTLGNACVTNLVYHLNTVLPRKISFDFRLVFSGYADRYLFQQGIFDTPLPFEEARQVFYIPPASGV